MIIDLEHVGGKEDYSRPKERRAEWGKRKHFLQLLTQTNFKVPLVIGCADIAPEDFPTGSKGILLHHTHFQQYMAWMNKRDQQRPDKAGQDYEIMHGHLKQFEDTAKYFLKVDPSKFEGCPDQMAISIWDQIDPNSKWLLF